MREVLPYAVGIAISPVPIAAILLLLTCPDAVVNGFAFLTGWIVGVAATAVVFVTLVDEAGLSDGDPRWIAIFELVLGVGFLLGAAMLLVRPGRHVARDNPWVDSVDAITKARSAGLGVVLSGANPKVLALSLGAALALAPATAGTSTRAEGVVALSVVSATGVLAPLAVFLVWPTGTEPALRRFRAWLGRHETTVLVAVGLVIGALFVRDGVQTL